MQFGMKNNFNRLLPELARHEYPRHTATKHPELSFKPQIQTAPRDSLGISLPQTSQTGHYDKILIWTRLMLDWIKTPLHQEEMHFLTTQKYNISPLQKNKPASSIDTDFLIEHPTCCAPNLSCL